MTEQLAPSFFSAFSPVSEPPDLQPLQEDIVNMPGQHLGFLDRGDPLQDFLPDYQDQPSFLKSLLTPVSQFYIIFLRNLKPFKKINGNESKISHCDTHASGSSSSVIKDPSTSLVM